LRDGTKPLLAGLFCANVFVMLRILNFMWVDNMLDNQSKVDRKSKTVLTNDFGRGPRLNI
jgi:hypothetical protein